MEPTSTKATLTVTTGDQAAEVFILNSNFQRVEHGIGKQASFELPHGLYTVKVRAGNDYKEEPIVLNGNSSVSFEPVTFTSPAPLTGTRKTHEFHVGNASLHSKNVHEKLGHGGQLYIFVRDWTKADVSTDLGFQNPANGLKLCDQQGQILISFFDNNYPHQLREDPWAACNVALDPGTYRLRLEITPQKTLEQTIVVSDRWQTQVFLLVKDYDGEGLYKYADLANAAIFIKPIQSNLKTGISDNEIDRLLELARQGLAGKRSVLSKEIIQQLLAGKFSDPMLGILGAHLLLQSQKTDNTLLTIVVENLRSMLGLTHPDVEALAVGLSLSSEYKFDLPPMLLPSWMLIVNASVNQPGILPTSSFANQIVGQILEGSPWLLWKISSETDRQDGYLLKQFERAVRLEVETDLTTNLPPDLLMDFMNQPTQRSITNSLDQPEPEQVPITNEAIKLRVLSDKSALERIVKMTGMPRNKVELMLKEI